MQYIFFIFKYNYYYYYNEKTKRTINIEPNDESEFDSCLYIVFDFFFLLLSINYIERSHFTTINTNKINNNIIIIITIYSIIEILEQEEEILKAYTHICSNNPN